MKVLLIVLGLPVIALVLRLVQLQIVRAGDYQNEAENLKLKPAELLPCLRGDITDRDGTTRLAFDAPSWNICVRYRVIAKDPVYLEDLAGYRFGKKNAAGPEKLRNEIEASWDTIAELAHVPRTDVDAVCTKIVQQVRALKDIVSQRRKVRTDVVEERIVHAVVKGLNQSQQVLARERLKSYEWVEIVADQVREYAGGPAFGHLLGRLTEVSRKQLENDPFRDDVHGELRCYQAGDLVGVSGLEAMGESVLRGQRGRVEEDTDDDGQVVTSLIEPRNGKNLRLTIDIPLQQEFYQLLGAAVHATPHCTGGCAVLLDIPSREVIAMVSYPGFDPTISWKDWLALGEDDLNEPTVFRAIEKNYFPGSTVKPMVLAAALTDRTVTDDTRINCKGKLFADNPRWKCDSIHGSVDPVMAIEQSCNVFFYTVGEQMHTPRLAQWMKQFGVGQRTGISLPRESPGHLPVHDTQGVARYGGIGQGEMDMTPLQVANMLATIASGSFRPVTLWADDPAPRVAVELPVSSHAWDMVREGLFRVVNHPHGTAYEYGRLTDAGDYVLLGKTGTAETGTRIYACRFPDGTVKHSSAVDRKTIQRRFPQAQIIGVHPPEDVEDPTHSWFTAYLTSRKNYLKPNNARELNVAIAVVIEYGGHGGKVAAPLAVEMIRAAIARQKGEIRSEGPGG